MMEEPNWYLTEDYGISLDPLNWRLQRKSIPKKKGNKPIWKTIGNYPTLLMLAEGLQRRVLLEYSDKATLKEHVEAAIKVCEEAISALNAQLDTIGAGASTKPPKYASYTAIKK
jgi:hypothetical protein